MFTGKHSQLIDVMELAKTLALERSPQVCNQDLCALMDPDGLAVELRFVPEQWEVFDQTIDQPRSRVLRVRDTRYERTVIFLGPISPRIQPL